MSHSYPEKGQSSGYHSLLFWLGIATVFLISGALRFWGLSRFNNPVFDETFYVKVANEYLHRLPVADGHPPLGKYFIAIGIWLSAHNPFNAGGTDIPLDASQIPAFSYRWMNALVGSFIPLLVAGLAYQLTSRRSVALLAALLTATDGLLLVESRYALINIYLIEFGLLGHWLVLFALDQPSKRRGLWLILAGLCFGACISVKWNGLAYLVGIYALWGLAQMLHWKVGSGSAQATDSGSSELSQSPVPTEIDAISPDKPHQNHFKQLAQLKPIALLVALGLTPIVTYVLLWIPHQFLGSPLNFLQLQQQIVDWQKQLTTAIHPYRSPWYSWPWMVRPMGYYFSQTQATADSTPGAGTTGAEKVTYYVVQGMGNPVLWWLSTIALIVVVGVLTRGLWQQWVQPAIAPVHQSRLQALLYGNSDRWVLLYLVVNYLINWLPWSLIQRSTFIYLYLGSLIFSIIALAWLLDRGFRSDAIGFRVVGATSLFLILLAFVFWLPIYLGFPISPEEFLSRMWFKSWI